MSLTGLKRALPSPVRRFGRAAYELGRGSLLDAADWARGRRRPLTPPRRLLYLIGSGRMDFHGSGDLLREFLIQNGLEPDHRVLDVGCGLGRLGVALTPFLSARGGYDGFDIMPAVIGWCRHITAARPNFRFQLVDVKSDRYRRGGSGAAAAFRFPYADASFDWVVLTSVFTHLRPADMRNYLSETARVLKPSGRALLSYYLMSEARRTELAKGLSTLTFAHRGEGFWAELPELPEAAIAYDEAEVLGLIEGAGLELAARYDGQWASAPLHSQDVLIATRRR